MFVWELKLTLPLLGEAIAFALETLQAGVWL
jgi:hypothetical protein